MDLIFNKDSTGAIEIRDITGFTDADFDFDSLKPFIEMATDELVKVVSADVYKSIQETYANASSNSSEVELIKKTQRAIAFCALLSFAPLKDLAFTNQGRAMRSDEHLKSAFEWQINRHNESMEAIYYRSLDSLIEALDKINPIITNDVKWKDTEAYKSSFDDLFRTTEEFNQFFNIESRYLLMKLIPGIRKVQNEELIPIMTIDRYKDYISKLKAGEEVEDPYVLSLMKEACAYLSLAWAVPRMSATLFPVGVLQNYIATNLADGSKQVPQKSEVGVITLLFENDGRNALMKLQEHLKPKECNDTPLIDIKIEPWKKFIST